MKDKNMLPQQYCLRWKYHHSNLQNMFSQLLDRGCFCDVTLACEGRTIKCHRVVLCACSTYFDSLLTNVHTDKDPIIIMRDCKFSDIKHLIEFMYKGEINVEHENLASLLKTAEDLRIKGLAEVSWRDENDLNRTNSMLQSSSLSSAGITEANGMSLPLLTPIPLPNKDNSPIRPTMVSSGGVGVGGGPTGGGGNGPGGVPGRKKRGRPPLDEEYDTFCTPKIAHVGQIPTVSFPDTSHLVACVMDDNSKEKSPESRHSFEKPRDQQMDFDNDNDPTKLIIPKTERPDTPPNDYDQIENEDEENGPPSPYDQKSFGADQSIFLTDRELEEWKDVIKMPEYLKNGRRPQFWEEPFTKRVMDAIKTKALEMKKAAKLLGVSYGTLYGRYRETYGCLKHPYRGPYIRIPWGNSEQGPMEILDTSNQSY